MSEQWSACIANGWKVNEQEKTVSGVHNGIAFRLTEGTDALRLEMSVNIADKPLTKLAPRLSAYGNVTAEHHGFGVMVTLAGTLSDERMAAWIVDATAAAAALIGVSHNEKFEHYGESVGSYLRGLAGALLGALVGVLPWIVAEQLLNIQFGWLGIFISIASFFGYEKFRGAHRTTYAMCCIGVFSLLAMVLGQAVQVLYVFYDVTGDLSVAWTMMLSIEVWKEMLTDILFGIVFAVIGVVLIRQKVLAYTHDAGFLRRRK